MKFVKKLLYTLLAAIGSALTLVLLKASMEESKGFIITLIVIASVIGIENSLEKKYSPAMIAVIAFSIGVLLTLVCWFGWKLVE